MKFNLYVLLPVHNRITITDGFIACLLSQTFKNYHLILIDDGSIDGTSEMVRSKVPNLTIIRGQGDWWWAGSLQQGLNCLKSQQLSNDDLVLFINDDLYFSPDYFALACSVMANKKGVLMLSQFLNIETNKITESGIYADMKNLIFLTADKPENINCLSTRGLFIHWEDIKVIGDFYPKLLPHYLSDYEYTMRAYRKGLLLKTSNKLLIEPNFETTGYHQFDQENFLSFVKKFFSKKAALNPLYWTSFILLASPSLLIKIINILRVWLGALKMILRAFFLRSKPSC